VSNLKGFNLNGFRRFLEAVSFFERDVSPDRNFGQTVMDLFSIGEKSENITKFLATNQGGLFLARLRIENLGWLVGMVTSIEFTDSKLTITIYGPTHKKQSIPLNKLQSFNIHHQSRHGPQFILENGKLIKTNDNPLTKPEGGSDEGPTILTSITELDQAAQI